MKENSSVVTKKDTNSRGKRESGASSGERPLRFRAAQLKQQLMAAAAKGGAGECTGRAEVAWYIGLDMGDKSTHYCVLDGSGGVVARGNLSTSSNSFSMIFSEVPRSRIALEVGTHSPWASELLKELGHEVYVANPRKVSGGRRRNRAKNDRLDAEELARLVKADPELLYPIEHRGTRARQALSLLRARDALVRARTLLINSTRGLVKPLGTRLPECSAESFQKIELGQIPEPMRRGLKGMLRQIGTLTAQIRRYDNEVERLCREAFPETELLRQVPGVGPVTSLAYVLVIDNPSRFAKSRHVGPYLGLVPRQYESGESSPQLRITKTGDRLLRRLLVQSSHYIMGWRGEDCDLRRQGMKLAARGAKNAKKRAVVAVARKLAVLLHRLWVRGEVYQPLYNRATETESAIAQ